MAKQNTSNASDESRFYLNLVTPKLLDIAADPALSTQSEPFLQAKAFEALPNAQGNDIAFDRDVNKWFVSEVYRAQNPTVDLKAVMATFISPESKAAVDAVTAVMPKPANPQTIALSDETIVTIPKIAMKDGQAVLDARGNTESLGQGLARRLKNEHGADAQFKPWRFNPVVGDLGAWVVSTAQLKSSPLLREALEPYINPSAQMVADAKAAASYQHTAKTRPDNWARVDDSNTLTAKDRDKVTNVLLGSDDPKDFLRYYAATTKRIGELETQIASQSKSQERFVDALAKTAPEYGPDDKAGSITEADGSRRMKLDGKPYFTKLETAKIEDKERVLGLRDYPRLPRSDMTQAGRDSRNPAKASLPSKLKSTKTLLNEVVKMYSEKMFPVPNLTDLAEQGRGGASSKAKESTAAAAL